jgi:hypothetical protein
MCAAIDVGIAHQDDAVIAQLRQVELVLADAGAERVISVPTSGDWTASVETRALDVEDLALERQDRLRACGRGPAWPSRPPSRPRR